MRLKSITAQQLSRAGPRMASNSNKRSERAASRRRRVLLTLSLLEIRQWKLRSKTARDQYHRPTVSFDAPRSFLYSRDLRSFPSGRVRIHSADTRGELFGKCIIRNIPSAKSARRLAFAFAFDCAVATSIRLETPANETAKTRRRIERRRRRKHSLRAFVAK